jgi:hypothetical protein
MPLTRLDNLLSSKTGKYIYVSPDDFNASDALDNRGNTPLRPFVTIQRAFLEVARYSYVPGVDNDRFDQFTIMLSPGTHYVDNRPGTIDTYDIPVFNFDAVSGEWNDTTTILDISNPDNVFYKFNGRDGGATIPRGTSLVGTDLRRTQVRALYVPDPADKDVPRCALFNVTGGCYFWQFTILDGNPESGPLNGKVYSQLNSTELSTPLYSHHKMTNFVFADKEDLSLLYRKISKCFSKYQTAIDDVYASEISANGGRISDTWDASASKTYAQNDTVVFGGNAYQALSLHTSSGDKRPDKNKTFWKILTTVSREFDYRIQENRIVGPLADTIQLDDVTITEPTAGVLSVKVKTKINHGFFPGQYVAISNTGFSALLEGVFEVVSISTTNPKEFTYRAFATLAQVSFASGETKVPAANATVQAEIDSVESASPYVFNVSIRSTWGICGIWADGRKATGFKSMVIAQYTGVSLQKDDRAFIRYDEFTNTWNQAPLTDAFASTPYHIKGDAYWKDDWRNFHVRASDDSFIQNVSIFAVGFADHFLLESGGDMSITNSNSNFGNTSMHSKGFKGFSFNQDKGGYITDIIPPQAFTSTPTIINTSYYAFDVQLTRGNKDLSGTWLAQPKLYISGDTSSDYLNRPAASINGYKLGARTYINDSKAEKIYTKISADTSNGETQPTVKEAFVYPQGFTKWASALTTLSPGNLGVGNFDNNPLTTEVEDLAFYNRSQDAANLIDSNKTFIQAEAFGYVIEKYPYLQTRSYVNPNIDADTGRYRDASNLIKGNRQEIVDYAFSQMQTAFPTFTVPGGNDAKCKRDIGYIIDALSADLYNGGNEAIINATKSYFGAYAAISGITRVSNVATVTTSSAHNLAIGAVVTIDCNLNEFDNASATVLSTPTTTSFTYSNAGIYVESTPATGTVSTTSGSPIAGGLVGEETQSIFAFNRAKDWAKKAISNLLPYKSKLTVTSITASGTTATITVNAAAPHGLKSGDVVTIGGATQSGYNGKWTVLPTGLTTTQFQVTLGTTPAASPATGAYYVSTVTIDPKNSLDQAGRYKDASDLVTSNRQEIIDRAFASVSLNYNETAWGTNWVTPGDSTTAAINRYRDAYRLIQKNKDEIIDRAAAEIGVQYPDFYYPGDVQTNPTSRYKDAYRLIQQNRATIITTAYAAIAAAYPAFTNPNPTKCQRDIGLFIDAVSLDISNGGGNRYTRKFIQNYFNNAGTSWISNGLQGEEAQSNVAFNSARDEMKKALTNQLAVKDLTLTAGPATYGGGGGNIVNTSASSCADVRSAVDTLTAIVTVNVTAGNLSALPAETRGYENRYDDAANLVASNKREIVDRAVAEIAVQYNEGLWGNNWVFPGDSTSQSKNRYYDSYRLIQKNRQVIIDNAFAEIAIQYPSFVNPNSTKCQRDIGFFIDVVSLDISRGGSNAYTRKFVQQYFDAVGPISNGLLGEQTQSIAAFTAASSMMKSAVTNTLSTYTLTNSTAFVGTVYTDLTLTADPSPTSGSSSNTNATSCANVRAAIDTLTAIVNNAITPITLPDNSVTLVGVSSLPPENYNSSPAGESKCRRDIGYLVDAIESDLRRGTNVATKTFISAYFSGNVPISNGLVGEEAQSIIAFNAARDMVKKALTNQLYVKNLLVSAGTATYGVGSTIISVDQSGNAAACIDVQNAVDTLVLIATDRIAAGNLTSAYSGRSYPANAAIVPGFGESKCRRDIGYFIDAVSLDISLNNSNRYSRKFVQQYFTNTTTPISGGLVGEEAQSNVAFNMARDMMKKALTNELYVKDLTLSAGPATYGGGGGNIAVDASGNSASCADVRSAVDTLTTLITARITAGNLTGLTAETLGTIPAGETKCKRDLGYIIDSISQDLFWGGNEFTVGAIREYFGNNGLTTSGSLNGEISQSVVAFSAAATAAKQAITNQLYTKNLTLSTGNAVYGDGLTVIPQTVSGNEKSCVDVQATIDTLFGIVSTTLNAGTLSSLPAVDNGDWDCANVRSTIDTLFSILTTTIAAGSLSNIPAVNPGKWSQISEASKCKRDIGYIVEAVTSDLRLGGNVNTINAGESYFTGTGNFTVTGTLGSITGLIATITGISSTAQLFAGMSVTKTTGAGAFGDNAIILSVDSLTQIKVQISSGSFTAGAITFKANRLDYIQSERVETLDAYDYVKQLMISSMRNHNTYIPTTNVSYSTASPIVTLTGGRTTAGLVVGMKVQSVDIIPTGTDNTLTNYNDTYEEIVDGRVVSKTANVTAAIATGTYIKRIISSTQFELGQYGSKLSNGLTKLPVSGSTANLFFSFESGSWSTAFKPTVDNTVIQVYNEYISSDGECSNIKTALDNYFTILGNVINNGVGSVDRIPSTINTGTFAQRATLFTLSTTGAPTDPHYLETGTPVRLVPRARDGKTPDKRLIRLPKGFDTNTIYYVIAPGRKTDPYDYSTTTAFNADAGSLQNIMLATSVENASAGIFIYSSETEAVDADVQIDVYQYVLDVSYNLNKYETTVKSSNLEILVTSEPHVFDVPTASDTITDTQKYQAVFFKPISAVLPSISGGSTLSSNKEYYVEYVSKYEFKIYDTLAGAVAGSSPITFISGNNSKFYTLSNKRRSPLRYDVTATTATNSSGTWYVMTDPSKTNYILNRIRSSDFATKDKTPDSYFQRLEDTRSVEDRTYRLRYVIPKYLQGVRDPLRGFVIKSRTDSTRKLLPQKILLKPTSTGNSVAQFSIPNSTAAAPGLTSGREYLGLNINSQGPNFVSVYDAYDTTLQDATQPLTSKPKFRVKSTTDSKITFYVQSARKKTVSGKDFLELTVFDIGIELQGYKQKIFTTIEISAPQGGDGVFIANTDNNATNNSITWTDGSTSGSGKVHAYYSYEGQHYLILKDINTITSTLRYSPFATTTFSQGSGTVTTATLLSEPDFGRSLAENNLYVTEGANVYTMTPGDTLVDDTGVSYTIASVEDTEDFSNTFSIYDVNTIRRRIYGQQDGIYYLTCVRGDISPYPTGSGVGENFRGYKFSQPISKLYPEFYKDDPEWYKQIDTTLIDPPSTVSAADNYIHGLVTVNDAKGSITREAILDFVNDPGSKQYVFSGNITQSGETLDVAIKAQEGTASAGSEGRKIPICGNSLYPTEQRFYVELRRPSIARSGNHTFEYLGFGPGNYSTGFPLRQEVVLTDVQDFYAQAKRENGGIVFYTGLNSNGDLYIGNRKINAITGKETYLESATLVTSSDAGDTIGNFVTTFDGPVTFNDKVSFLAPISRSPIVFQAPIQLDVPATDPASAVGAASPASIEILSNRRTGDDENLGTNSKTGRPVGSITLTGNKITSAIYQFNARGQQQYSFRTAVENWTPNQLNPYGGGSSQAISFGSVFPLVAGDILLKGEQVGFTGSLGWIYANNFAIISHTSLDDRISTITGYGIGQNKIRISWSTNLVTGIPYTNADIGITSSNFQIRLSGGYSTTNNALKEKTLGTWSIISSGFSTANTYIDVQITDYVDTGIYNIAFGFEPNLVISYTNNSWKEVGVIGAEAIRTETDNIGNYKIGINTVARAATSAYLTGFVDSSTTAPRANLDLVGTAFISGKTQPSGSSFETSTTKTETGVENAFLIGGYSSSPSRIANLRVDTLNNRVGINTTKSQNVSLVARSITTSSISSVSRNASNVSTITTATAHGYVAGDTVYVNVTTGGYTTFNNSGSIVTVLASPAPGVNTFSYNNTGSQVSTTTVVGTTTKQINVATITTNSAHGYSIGDTVVVSISGSTYNTLNGTVTIIASPAPTATAFSYLNTNQTAIAATALPGGTTGTVTKPGTELDRSFVVGGNARITGDFMFESDINVNGGDITTTVTSGEFNFLNQSTFVGTFNSANYATTINIGNSTTNGQTINVGTSSSNSVINIGNPATTTSNISKINIGGAYGNNESQSYVSVNTKSFRTSGDVLLGTSRNLPDSLTIGSTAGTVNFFNSITSTLNFGSAVSSLVMGGQGGSTRIRNSLTVNGSITGNSNITLIGGLLGLNFTGVRSQLGSTGTSHTGTLTPPVSNTVDIVSIITTNSNLIDTPANAVWGSTATNADFQQSFTSAGITLPAVTGNYYYLPLKNAPIGTNSISVNDFLIINSTPSAGRYPEIVQVDELSQISGSGPYWIKVKRTPLGSFLPKPSNGHLDDTVIYKVIIQFNSTWVTTTINSGDTAISIAEIGGTINTGDYIIVDRISTDANDANGSESGEAIKISSSSALISKKFTINDGASPNPVTFFSVDSTNGNTIIGNPDTTSSNGNLSIYGGFTLSGGTPTGSTECEKLTLTDKYDTTFQVNTCTGDTTIGNQVGRIELVPLVLNNNGTSSLLPSISTILANYQNSTDTVIYAYSDDQTTINAGGPLTTTSGAMTIASSLYSTYYLPVQNISGFSNSDLILVGSTTTGVFEIMQLADNDAFLTPGSMVVYRAREGTSAITVAAGLTVKKIIKHPETANLIDIAQRTRTATTASPTTPFLSAILDLGYIVQTKIDYKQYVRMVRGNYSAVFSVPQTDGTIESGRLLGTRHLPGIDESRQNGAFPFRRGKLTINDNFKMIGGNFTITDSTNRSELFRIFNDDGHAEHSAAIGWIANVRGRGDFFLYGSGCPESVLISTAGYDPTFSVDSLGNARVLLTLGVTGVAAAVPSSGISSLSIDNLGVNGANKFTIKQTGEIDSFGYSKFYTATGARHTRYVSTTSTDDAKILSPNIVYMANVTSQDTLILTLPSSPKTGDTVKIVEVGGNLSYQTTLVVRAPGTAVKVQGDSTGTLFGGRSTAYPSGELVVQTPNAAFTLVYLGSEDSNGQVGVPATVQGWWLMEV